jgi:acyl phosphate:glycerol-3-phosphate acyltransferase
MSLMLICLLSYLIGAIPFGFLVARLKGVDIFQVGSGNIGATNVGRVLGRPFGLLVFALDFAKGALPVCLSGWIIARLDISTVEPLGAEGVQVLAGLSAILGHMFPVYLRFHGGKGVATGAGVVAVLLPWQTLGALVVWIGIVSATGIVSIASLGGALGLFLFRLCLTPQPWADSHRMVTLFCCVAMILVFIRHRPNIVQLLQGSENRLRETPTMLRFTKTIHALALGLWFGSVVFFMLAALVIFHTFEHLAASETLRPSWIAPEELTREHGTQLAGIAIGPLFDWYFPLQGICAFLAVTTALGFARTEPSRALHKVRSAILFLALVTVLAGWPLARYVGHLRTERYSPQSAVAIPAQEVFEQWHGISLLTNFGTLILVTAGMSLAGHLPNVNSATAAAKEP